MVWLSTTTCTPSLPRRRLRPQLWRNMVGVAHHPMRGVGKGFGAEGGFTRNEGGGGRMRHHGTIAKKLYCRRWGG